MHLFRPEEAFDVWAPSEAPWSPWAKPLLFVHMRGTPRTLEDEPPLPDLPGVPPAGDSAVVVDLPGPFSVHAGLALAVLGYRPVPLYNGTPGRQAVVDVEPVVDALSLGTAFLERQRLPTGAPPAFLLDADRDGRGRRARPGMLDNRWFVFPQDVPSANLLLSRHIRRVVVLREEGLPHRDLGAVLLRWRKAGIGIEGLARGDAAGPSPMDLPAWRGLASLAALAMAAFGLRRSHAGGFGSRVPEPSQGSGYFG
jgi:hypothetical protein